MMDSRVLVELGTELVGRGCARHEIVEYIDKLAKHKVHQRQQNTRGNHADSCDARQDPSRRVIVLEDALILLVELAVGRTNPKKKKINTHNIASHGGAVVVLLVLFGYFGILGLGRVVHCLEENRISIACACCHGR